MRQILIDAGTKALLAGGASVVTSFVRLWVSATLAASGSVTAYGMWLDHTAGITVIEAIPGWLFLTLLLSPVFAVPMLVITAIACVVFGALKHF